MAKQDLPPIFKRFRQLTPREHLPKIVLSVDYANLPPLPDDPDASLPLTLWDMFWLEIKNIDYDDGDPPVRFGVLNRLDLERPTNGGPLDVAGGQWAVICYNYKGETIDMFFMNDAFSGAEGHARLNSDQKAAAMVIARAVWYIHLCMEGPGTEQEMLPMAPTQWVDPIPVEKHPAYFERKGDTVCYASLNAAPKRVSAPVPESHWDPNHEPAFRKRDHEVRGHWRTYRSGRKVWIRGHRRGDPELGTVTRVLRG